MKNWAKKHFIPHKGNNHAPHLLRKKGTFILLGAALLIEIAFLAQIILLFPNSNFLATILPNVLVDFTNARRETFHLSYLAPNPKLEEAARLKAEHMAANGYFSHIGPDGTTPWDWIDTTGYVFTYAGENLAINFLDSEEVIEAWMNSERHKENILNNKFTEVGIGSAKGMYKGEEAIFVVQLFAAPAKTIATALKSDVPSIESPREDPRLAGEDIGLPNIENVESEVLGITTEKPEGRATIPQKLMASPTTTTNIILIILGGLVSLVLLLMFITKAHLKHPFLVFNAVIVLSVFGIIILANKYLVVSGAEI